jgi:hypothetical protein
MFVAAAVDIKDISDFRLADVPATRTIPDVRVRGLSLRDAHQLRLAASPVTIQILQSMGSESALPDTWVGSKYGPHPAPAGHLSGLAHRLLSGGVLANPGAVAALRLAMPATFSSTPEPVSRRAVGQCWDGAAHPEGGRVGVLPRFFAHAVRT